MCKTTKKCGPKFLWFPKSGRDKLCFPRSRHHCRNDLLEYALPVYFTVCSPFSKSKNDLWIWKYNRSFKANLSVWWFELFNQHDQNIPFILTCFPLFSNSSSSSPSLSPLLLLLVLLSLLSLFPRADCTRLFPRIPQRHDDGGYSHSCMLRWFFPPK